MIKIHLLHCGSVRVDEAVPHREVGGWHPAPYTGFFRSKSHQVILPVSAYLIEHPYGRILVDTGWHSQVRQDVRGHLGWAHSLVNLPILPEGQAVDEQLAQHGLRPEDLDYVVLTHLHDDHVSGLKLVERAGRILTSDIEYREAMASPVLYQRRLWRGVDVQTFSFGQELAPELGMGFATRCHDLLGDGSVLLVHVPGHTLGMCAVLVRGEAGEVLLCADAAYSGRAISEGILPGIVESLPDAERSFGWVQRFATRPQARVLTNHDPELHPETILI